MCWLNSNTTFKIWKPFNVIVTESILCCTERIVNILNRFIESLLSLAIHHIPVKLWPNHSRQESFFEFISLRPVSLGPDRYSEGLRQKLFDNQNADFIFTILESVNLRQAKPVCAWPSQTYTFVTIYSLGRRPRSGFPLLHFRISLVCEASQMSISSDRWFCCAPSPQHQYPLFYGGLTRVSTLQSLLMNCKCVTIMALEVQNTFFIVICGAHFYWEWA